MPKKGDSTSIIERIKRKTVISKSGCHEFTGSLADGYGYVSSDIPGQSPRRVHVVMWIHLNGPIPKAKPVLCVLHKCDNRKCHNPKHLFLGTRKKNNEDMIEKGRADLSHKGKDNAAAKLSDDDVLTIRQSELSYRRLAGIYNVSFVLIGKIKRREIWRHL